MKTVRIFLASSINEFVGLRDRLTSLIEGRNQYYRPQGIELQTVRCEDRPRHFSGGRMQENLNAEIETCDFFFLLAGRDIGNATREEFDAAYRCFRDSGPAETPKIRVFFEARAVEETTPELRRFREYVREKLGQYPDKFTHPSEVEREILLELVDSLALLDPAVLEAGKRRREEIAAEIARNRKEIAALLRDSATEDGETAGAVTVDNLAEIAARYRRNAALTEEHGMDWRTLEEYADFLRRQGSYRRAIDTAARLDAHYGPADDPDERAGIKVLLGKCHMALDEYEPAEDDFRAALDLYRPLAEDAPEDYAPDAAEVCVLLAEVMVKTYRVRAAERLYREALALYLPCALEEQEEYAAYVGQVCHALRGLVSRDGDRNFEAEILQRGEEAFLDCAVKGDGDRTEPEGENLSIWLEQYPCPDEAGQLLRQAEEQAREATKDNPVDYDNALADVCGQFGVYLRKHNRMEDAEALARRSLELFQALAEADPAFEKYVASSRNSLGMVLANTDRPMGAEQFYHQAVEIFTCLMETDPSMEKYVASVRDNLAILFRNYSRLSEAEQVHRETLETRRCLAEKDPDIEKNVAVSCHNLAVTLANIGKTGEAELLYREALEIRRRLARQNPDIESDEASICNGLGALLDDTGRTEEAERFFNEALEIYRRLAEKDPSRYEPNLAHVYNNLGIFMLTKKNNRVKALEYFDKAIAIWEKYPRFEKRLDNAHRGRSLCL